MSDTLKRISVVGTTGSGKTTLAKKISFLLNIPHIELDAIHWQENWDPLPVNIFRAEVAEALSIETWVVDGNYGKVRDLVWSQADTVIWLDYGLGRIYYQLLKRTIQRVFTREELWNANRERFQAQFLSRDSLFVWALKTYPQRRKLYPELFKKPEHSHLNIIRLASPRDTGIWLSQLNS